MQFNLEAGTDVAQVAVFDPSAVPHLPDGSVDAMKELDNQTVLGNLLVYQPGSDGGYTFRVYVDEEPDEPLIKRAEYPVKDALLRVPSGRLVVAGLEDLWPRPKKHTTPGDYRPNMGGECSVKPGNYLVNAFEVAWDEECSIAVNEEIKAHGSTVALKAEGILGPLMGLVVFGTIMCVGVSPFVWLFEGWRAALTLLEYVLIAEAVFWPPFLLAAWLTGAFSRNLEIRKRVEAMYPDVVVVLHPLPSDADLTERKGSDFGINAGRSGKKPKKKH